MERGNLLLANNIIIGLSFGFFTMMIKSMALPDPRTPPLHLGPVRTGEEKYVKLGGSKFLKIPKRP